MYRGVGVVLVALAVGGPPTPQQPYLHPRLFILLTAMHASVNPVEGISTLGFERDADTTSRATIYAPQGTTIELGQAPGTVIGTPGVRLEVAGTTLAYNPVRTGLVAADPAAYANNTCAPGPHDGVWLVQATPTKNYGPGPAQRLPIELPVYVDRVVPSPANLGSAYELQICFGSTGWPAGAVVRRMTLNFAPGIVSERAPSPGTFDWRGVFTTAGASGTVESRALLSLPVELILKGTYSRTKRRIALLGTLTQGGAPVPGADVLISYGSKLSATGGRAVAPTSARGAISISIPATRTTYVRGSLSTLSLAYVDDTGCAGPSLATGGCLTATQAGFTLFGSVVRVAVP